MTTRQTMTPRHTSYAVRNATSLPIESSSSKNEQATAPNYLTSIMCFAVAVTAISTAIFILHAPQSSSSPYLRLWAQPSLSGATPSASTSSKSEPGLYPPVPVSPSRIFAPSLRGADALPHANRTIFVFTESCTQRNNYSCKFWFHLRCLVLAAFPNVVALPPRDWVAMLQFEREVRSGDVAILPWRMDYRSPTPKPLAQLLAWRDARARADDSRQHIRIGVFHFANEHNRTHWPWYPKADFVLRNYWTNRTSPHVQYIPLGGQVPEACPSDKSGDSANFQTLPADRPLDRATNGTNWREETETAFRRRDACACDGVKLTNLNNRRFLWSFSGSLQKGRPRLVERLRRDPDLLKRGQIQVATKFGGDGQVGSGGKNDTKTSYLEAVMSSQMVFCPCGGAMETHRIYEALNHGAVPVIEKCDKDERADFFPFTELMIEDGIKGLVDFVRRYADDKPGLVDLQKRVMIWWREYSTEVALNVTRVIVEEVPERLRTTM